jgi:glycosyltransferase involved in cell wall biosynthesis
MVAGGEAPLADALRLATGLTDETRESMGARGRAFAQRELGWDRIGTEMLAVYEWILHGGVPPTSVRLD